MNTKEIIERKEGTYVCIKPTSWGRYEFKVDDVAVLNEHGTFNRNKLGNGENVPFGFVAHNPEYFVPTNPEQSKAIESAKDIVENIIRWSDTTTVDVLTGKISSEDIDAAKERFTARIEKLLSHQREEIQQDLRSVINFLKGSTEREKIINYIKKYLLSTPTRNEQEGREG